MIAARLWEILRRAGGTLFTLGLVVGFTGCGATGFWRSSAAVPDAFAVGADVSFLGEAEAAGVRFSAGGEVRPGLELLRERGYGWVRLRLFHTPSAHRTKLPNDLAYTLALAREAKDLGFKVLLDIHYSDTWADPAKQSPPLAWAGLEGAALVSAVHEYTRSTVAAFYAAGVPPDVVQPGNEIIGGMLWPHGQLPGAWDEFVRLLRAGIEGVRAGAGDAPPPKILVHIDRGGDWPATKWFFDGLRERGVEPDLLGQSFYPWWHGGLDDLRTTLHAMAERYGRPIWLVETAYCWRPTEFRERPGPFPETPEGQRDYLAAVAEVVRDTPRGLGGGVFWWEPAVGYGRGRTALRARGLFDDAGEALPALDVFRARTAER